MMSVLDFYNENYGGETKIPAAAFSLWERRISDMGTSLDFWGFKRKRQTDNAPRLK